MRTCRRTVVLRGVLRRPQPADFTPDLVSRTVGDDRIVDEMLVSFTHDIEVPWILPGVPPSGRRVEIPVIAIVGIRDGLVDSEHIYWDQASVLVQVGLLDARSPSTRPLPVLGVDQSRTLVDDAAPLNALAAGSAPA
jgi:carboxymethylenebutenolidase